MHDNSTVILIGEEVHMLSKKIGIMYVQLLNQLCQLHVLDIVHGTYSYSNKYCRIHRVNRLCFRYEMNVGLVNIDELVLNFFLYFSDLEDLKPKNSKAKLVMFGDYDTDGSKTYVEDPYYVSLPF